MGSSKPRMGTSDRSLFMGSLSLLGDVVRARGARVRNVYPRVLGAKGDTSPRKGMREGRRV